MRCPTCRKLGVPVELSMFCTQQCFKDNWTTHKQFHKMYKQSMNGALVATPASSSDDDLSTEFKPTMSDLELPPEFRNYMFTGAYRPARVTPMRTVPPHISKPDYADDGIPHSEMRERGNRRAPVRTPDEIRRLREVCRLGREILDTTGKAVAA